jgi:hypothetical protein
MEVLDGRNNFWNNLLEHLAVRVVPCAIAGCVREVRVASIKLT